MDTGERTFAGLPLWSPDSQLAIAGHDQTAGPGRDVLGLEQRVNPIEERGSPRRAQPDQQQAVVGARRIAPEIGEVEILRDQETAGVLGAAPDLRTSCPARPSWKAVSTSWPRSASVATSRSGGGARRA